MSLTVYQAPKGKTTTLCYPITLIDGTGSMGNEYDHIIEAYNDVFKNIDKKEQYQWAQQLFDLQPFRRAGWGNITNTFKQILKNLLQKQEQYPKAIAIIFVSDGEEEFELKQLQQLIKEVKNKYLISFISVAVGDSFPNQISNQLYDQIHNQNKSICSLYKIQRGRLSSNEILIKSKEIFNYILTELQVQEDIFKLNHPVKTTLGSNKKVDEVVSGQVFVGPEVVKTIDGQDLQPTKNVEAVEELIINSIKQTIVDYSVSDKNNESKEQLKKQCEIIKQESVLIIENLDFEGEINQQQQNHLEAVGDILTGVIDGEIKIETLTDDKRTNIQLYIESNIQNRKELEGQPIQISQEKKQNNLGCMIRARVQQLKQDKQNLQQQGSQTITKHIFKMEIFVS